LRTTVASGRVKSAICSSFHQDQDDANGKENRVDKSEGILPKDLKVGSARLKLDVVSLAGLASRDDLTLG